MQMMKVLVCSIILLRRSLLRILSLLASFDIAFAGLQTFHLIFSSPPTLSPYPSLPCFPTFPRSLPLRSPTFPLSLLILFLPSHAPFLRFLVFPHSHAPFSSFSYLPTLPSHPFLPSTFVPSFFFVLLPSLKYLETKTRGK
jgi:hypothetical protein